MVLRSRSSSSAANNASQITQIGLALLRSILSYICVYDAFHRTPLRPCCRHIDVSEL
jgi:hypothetical protein